MQSLHSLKCEAWSFIKDRNIQQYISDEDIKFIKNRNNNKPKKFDIIRDHLMQSDEAFDNATNYDIGRVEGYKECLQNLQSHFRNINIACESVGHDKARYPIYCSSALEEIFTSLLKYHE